MMFLLSSAYSDLFQSNSVLMSQRKVCRRIWWMRGSSRLFVLGLSWLYLNFGWGWRNPCQASNAGICNWVLSIGDFLSICGRLPSFYFDRGWIGNFPFCSLGRSSISFLFGAGALSLVGFRSLLLLWNLGVECLGRIFREWICTFCLSCNLMVCWNFCKLFVDFLVLSEFCGIASIGCLTSQLDFDLYWVLHTSSHHMAPTILQFIPEFPSHRPLALP